MVVLSPVDLSNDPQQDFLSDGLTEALTTALHEYAGPEGPCSITFATILYFRRRFSMICVDGSPKGEHHAKLRISLSEMRPHLRSSP
jgi:hypothetical protein